MESPIRKYQQEKDYQRHKLFRKIKRRRRAQALSALDAPIRMLRRKLGIPKFAGGKEPKEIRKIYIDSDGRSYDDLGNDLLVYDDNPPYGDIEQFKYVLDKDTNIKYTPYNKEPDTGYITKKGAPSGLKQLAALSNQYRFHPILGSISRAYDAWNNAMNNPSGINPLDIASAVAIVAGVGGIRKPLTPKLLSKMSLQELGDYFKANPHLLKDIEVTNNVRNFYNNDVLPRLAKQTKKPLGFTADDLINSLKFKAGNFEGNKYGGYYSADDDAIVLNDRVLNDPKLFDRVLTHEISHGMYNRVGYTPEAASKLEQAYRFSPEYLATHPGLQRLPEMAADNTATRLAIAADNGWLTRKPLDKVINDMDPTAAILYYNGPGASAYARDWAKSFTTDMGPLKRALTGVAGTLPFVIAKDSISYKDGKLPGYKFGVVSYNPTNATINQDGTFTDDYTKIFDDLVITPKGVTTKYGSYTDKNWDRYKQLENYFKYHDQLTGKVKVEPGLEIVSPEFDIISGIRGVVNLANHTKKQLQKSLQEINNSADIAKEPYTEVAKHIKTSMDIAKESPNIHDIVKLANEAKIANGNVIARAYSKIRNFLESPAYRKRLEKYYRDKGSSIITLKQAPGDRIGEQLYNIQSAKASIRPRGELIDENGTLRDSYGLYDPNSHSIQIASDAMTRQTPEHEMWHAARNARAYLDNEKYKMRVRGLSDLQYYGDIAEQEVRVLDTLREMHESGLDINNLTDDQIWNFLHEVPIDMHGTNVQSLIDNYWYDDIKNALRNFKNIVLPLGFGGIGYGTYNKYAE